MAGDKFDPFGDAERSLKTAFKWGQATHKLMRARKAKQEAAVAELQYGPEVAEAVENAVRAGKDHERILRQAAANQQGRPRPTVKQSCAGPLRTMVRPAGRRKRNCRGFCRDRPKVRQSALAPARRLALALGAIGSVRALGR